MTGDVRCLRCRAKLEIELTPSISAETQIGQQGQTGSSLHWTYDY
jgi:hypothetical protein